jgi:hypothetical protein
MKLRIRNPIKNRSFNVLFFMTKKAKKVDSACPEKNKSFVINLLEYTNNSRIGSFKGMSQKGGSNEMK